MPIHKLTECTDNHMSDLKSSDFAGVTAAIKSFRLINYTT